MVKKGVKPIKNDVFECAKTKITRTLFAHLILIFAHRGAMRNYGYNLLKLDNHAKTNSVRKNRGGVSVVATN